MLILKQQADVITDRRGRARLTEYELAPINSDYGLLPIDSDSSFTVAATPGVVGISRWLAPELILPARKKRARPVMEPEATDLFALTRFDIEIVIDDIPFEEQKNEAVVLRISRESRPEVSENAQAIGLTGEMWKLVEGCWLQNLKKRPTMEGVVERRRKFVENDNSNGIIGCVQITLIIRTLSSAPFLTSMIDLGAHHPSQGRQRGPVDNERGLRPYDPKRGLSSFNLERSLKPFDSERLLRRFDKKRRLRPSDREQNPRIPISYRVQGCPAGYKARCCSTDRRTTTE